MRESHGGVEVWKCAKVREGVEGSIQELSEGREATLDLGVEP